MEEDNNNEELENDEAQEPQEQEGQSSSSSNLIRDEAKNQAQKQIKKEMSKAVTKNAAKHSALAALGPILFWVAIIIVIIIIIVGIVMFFITMPGMVMDQLKQLALAVGDIVASWFGESTTTQIAEKDVFSVLDYLEEMGYDLKGYGFLTDYVGENRDGVERDEDDKISDAESDFIYAYLISENYVYTIKNFNLNTSWWVAIFDHLSSLLTDSLKNRTGMLVFYHEGDGIGRTSDNAYDAFERGSIKVDVESKKLEIKKGWTNNTMTFNLDGWTGRYGMPIDFLLSIHLATMMPDLAYDMSNSFKTEVNILLHKSSGQVEGTYKGASGNVNYESVSNAINGLAGKNIFSSIITKIDEWGLNASEAQALLDLGMIPPFHDKETCGCEYNTTYSTSENGMQRTIFPIEDESFYEIYNLDKNCKYYYYSYDDTGFNTQVIGLTEEELKSKNPEAKEELVKVGDKCKDYLKKSVKYMRKANDYSYETYMPYVENVTDHWYRDVYFIADQSTNFVDYDYDYESIMKERWTLYETDENGDYVYYEIDENGNYKKNADGTDKKYNGKVIEGKIEGENDDEKRVASVGEDGTKIAKKAVLVNMKNSADDLDWNYLGNGIYSAYATDENNMYESQKVYHEGNEIYDDADEDTRKVLDSIYSNVLLGSIKQTGEGQRTETNSKIKKMFLENTYFRYTGSAEDAEIITALRRDNNIEYGPLSKSDLSKEAKVGDKTYKVSDYSGQVSLNQDSLNAFSMLENEHTLDADYIYRDFKELIVELGYYKKEELTDETPRLLEFLVPELGSYGYPKRIIDKNENEFGTMVHSKDDIEAITKTIISPKEIKSNSENGPSLEEESNNNENDSKKTVTSRSSRISNSSAGTSTTGFKRDTLIDTATACWQYIVDSGKYTYAGASIPITGGTTVDCSSYVSWILYEYGFEEFKGGQHCTQDFYNTNWNETMGWEEIAVGPGADCSSQLQAGDIFVRDDGSNNGHVQFILSIEGDGTILTYDCGSASHWVTANRDGYASNFAKGDSQNRPGKIIRIESATQEKGEKYEGYSGNEGVVSPVTGVLLEYGTYDGKEKDSVSGEIYRTNIDLKNGVGTKSDTEETAEKNNTNKNDTSQIKPEKVGYAKILVLDTENYKKIESGILKSTRFSSSFVSKTDKYTESDLNNLTEAEIKDKNDPWTDLDKTLYGYKEFAESYEKAGIAGNIIYIEGFKAELPDEEFDNKDKQLLKTKSPSGEKLTIDSFEKITLGNFSNGNINNEDDLIDSLYEKEEEYKLASKRATEKLKAENLVKDEAISSLYVNGLRIIKEGTLIGRTLTDRELIVDYRGENYEDYKNESSSNDEDVDKIVGNYLRIIMRDLDKTVVENVEDYMKLDDGEKDKVQAEHFSVIDTVLSEDEWVEKAYAYMQKNPGDGTFNNKEALREMYKICKEKGVNPEFIFVRGIQESGYNPKGNHSNYWGYNTPNSATSLWDGGTWQNVLGKYCDTIVKYQDPDSNEYSTIMQRYDERKSCTENGGIDPYGYGEPNSVQGLQSLYSWLGDDHSANDPGAGGMYYLYPWGWGGNQYEGENKIIFESKQEFESLCGGKHGTSGGKTSSTPTTVWEQGMYTAWQSKQIIDRAKLIFGELAGTHDP